MCALSPALLSRTFFAGFSGGPKGIIPGLAGIKTIMHLPNAEMIGDPRATWMQLEGNPIHGEIREAVAMMPPHFMVNVAIKRRAPDHGGLGRALPGPRTRSPARFVAENATCPVEEPFDIVITHQQRLPARQNLYQSVKGMSAAARIVKPDGAIVSVPSAATASPITATSSSSCRCAARRSRCWRCWPSLASRCTTSGRPEPRRSFSARPMSTLYSSLDAATVRAAMLKPIDDIAATLAMLIELYGPDARIAVLPEGPQTVPYLMEAGPRDAKLKRPEGTRKLKWLSVWRSRLDIYNALGLILLPVSERTRPKV